MNAEDFDRLLSRFEDASVALHTGGTRPAQERWEAAGDAIRAEVQRLRSVDLREWLQAEFAKAREAAHVARLANEDIRQREGPKAVGCRHVSAVARMCALGEVLQRLDEFEHMRAAIEAGNSAPCDRGGRCHLDNEETK